MIEATRRYALAALFFVAAPGPVDAQVTLAIDGAAACDECRIEAELTTRLGDIREPASPTMESRVAIDGSNVFYVGPSDLRGSILRYDVDGSFLGSFGEFGQGPEEFSRISYVASHRDTLHVFDAGNGRYSVTTTAGDVVRTLPVPGRIYSALVFDGGITVAQGPVSTSAAVAEPVHVYDYSEGGGYVRSFGRLPDDGPGIENTPLEVRPLGRGADDDTFWMARRDRYEVQLWTTDGGLVKRITREGFADAAPEEAAIIHVREDDAGRLWVMGTIRLGEPGERVRETGLPGAVDRDAMFDTVIEVIDHEEGRLIASRRFDFAPPFFFSTDLAFATIQDDAGWGLEILRFRLSDGDGG